jgi:hypothetical protein
LPNQDPKPSPAASCEGLELRVRVAKWGSGLELGVGRWRLKYFEQRVRDGPRRWAEYDGLLFGPRVNPRVRNETRARTHFCAGRVQVRPTGEKIHLNPHPSG